MLACFTTDTQSARPIFVMTPLEFQTWVMKQDAMTQAWLADANIRPEMGFVSVVPGKDGRINCVICCVADKNNFWSFAGLALSLPKGTYSFVNGNESNINYALAWGLGAYQFTRYKVATREASVLAIPAGIVEEVENLVSATYLVRDLINIPADDLGPTELAVEVRQLASRFHADFYEVVGDDLLKANYPAIYAVGRACDDPPRLLEMRWGDETHPKVTLVGKGVCFDTGGLDLKSSSNMLLMKKDMGGAANVLGLACMVMQAKLPVRLRVLIPAVENAVSSNAYRPGDVVKSRSGKTIEIGNTDAEGRVILADALTEAVSEKPDLIIDMATLTGAARVAVGTDIAAVFSNTDDVVNAVLQCSDRSLDPVWRLPLYAGYRDSINSAIADLNNVSADGYAGAIVAALFLKEFVPDDIPWLHFDIMAWNTKSKPGKPIGGEAMAVRSLFAYLTERFAN